MADEPVSDALLMGRTLDIIRLLWAIDHGLQSTSKRMAQRYGVTGPQRAVLRVIGQEPGISAGELADAVFLHPSTLTGILRRLASRGLVARIPDEGDARRLRLYLTEPGQAFTRVRTGTVEASLRKAIARCSADELRISVQVLSEIAQELNLHTGKSAPVAAPEKPTPHKPASHKAASNGTRR